MVIPHEKKRIMNIYISSYINDDDIEERELDKKDLKAYVERLKMVTSDNTLFYDSEPFGELLNVVVQDIDSLRKEIKKDVK